MTLPEIISAMEAVIAKAIPPRPHIEIKEMKEFVRRLKALEQMALKI